MEGLDLFHGPNAGYALDLYDQYLRDRESVDPQTRALFDLIPLTIDAGDTANAIRANGAATMAYGSANTAAISDAARLARNIRGRGHLAAHLDPLGSAPQDNPGLHGETYHLSPADLAALPAEVIGGPAVQGAANAQEAIERLRAIYEGT